MPVIGFMGWTCCCCGGAARFLQPGQAYEQVRLTEASLIVERVAANGATRRWTCRRPG